MGLKEFTAGSILEIDGGKVAAAINMELKHLVTDCQDRPADDRPRKLQLTVTIEPIMDEARDLERCDFKCQVTSTVPSRKTKKYSFGVRRNGIPYFNTDAPDSPDQGTLTFDEEES